MRAKVLSVIVSLLPALAQDRITAITGATLIDGNGGTPIADSVVVVRGSRIAAAGPRAATPELSREPKPENQDHGMGTILAIEGLVELGMTPAQALTAATKNGALACRRSADFGTIEPGKLADLVILDADPLANIHNIRKVNAVMKEGRTVELARLPELRILSRP